VAIGLTASVFVGQIGTTLADVTTCSLILGALALMIASRNQPTSVRLIAICGLAIGAATGLKLTNAVYVLGALATPWWLGMARRDAVRQFATFGAALLVGFLLTHGYWSWLLFERFGSPLFPFYNTIFHSPWFPNFNVTDDRYPAGSFLRGAIFSFRWALGDYPNIEASTLDARFAAVELLVPIGAIGALLRARDSLRTLARPAAAVVPLLMLAVFFVVSYIPWVFVFGVARYVVALALISGIIIVGIAIVLFGRARAHVVAVVATVLLIVWTVPLFFGRTTFEGNWYGVEVPAERSGVNELFVMIGDAPIAYVIPSFPRDARFVRVDSFLGEEALDPGMPTGAQIVDTIQAHAGPIYSLGLTPAAAERERLAEYGLSVSLAPCVAVPTRIDDVLSCELQKT
jgi:hypothetical protein